jgi:hypothetical protein
MANTIQARRLPKINVLGEIVMKRASLEQKKSACGAIFACGRYDKPGIFFI